MQIKRFINAKIGTFLYYVGITLVLILLNSFSFGSNFETQTSMQKNAIVFLGTYCFHGDFYTFWQTAIVSFIFLLIISTTLTIQSKNEYLNFIKYFLLIQGLIHYFFWVFVHKYSPIFENQLLNDFLYSILYLFGIQIFEFVIIWAINTSVMKKKKKEIWEMQAISYKCPNCGKIFQSNVIFCSECLKEISSIEIPLNKRS